MLAIKILDKYIVNKEECFNHLHSYSLEQINEIVIDIQTFYRYLKDDLPYHLKFTEKQLYDFLFDIIHDKSLLFSSRWLCVDKLGLNKDREVVLKFLTQIADLDLVQVMQNNINIDNCISLLLNIYEETDEYKNLIQKFFSTNTIIRGKRTFDYILSFLHNRRWDEGYEYTNFFRYCLTSYYFYNPNSSDNLICCLDYFEDSGLLTPEIFILAQQKVGEDQRDIDNLAQWFIRRLNNLNLNYLPFRRWAERIISPERRMAMLRYNYRADLNSQDVHILDTSRTKFLEWLSTHTKDFNHNAVKMIETKVDSWCNNDESVRKTMQNIYENKTLIVFVYEGQKINWKLEEIFLRILFVISMHQNKDQLIVRLNEELIDMSGTCFSGHINRLFNVFAGIEKDLVIVDMIKEIKKSIKLSLQNVIDEAPENIRDEIIEYLGDQFPKNIKEYIYSNCEKLFDTLEKYEIEDYQKVYRETVNEYFGNKIYSI